MQRFLRFDSSIMERNEIFDFSINGLKEFYSKFSQTMPAHTFIFIETGIAHNLRVRRHTNLND